MGELATYVNGYAFKPEDWSENGAPIIRIQNLTGNMPELHGYEGRLDEKYRVVAGDILISWSASLGVYEWTQEDGWLNQHIFKVVFDKEQLDKTYFKYAASRAIEKSATLVHGSTMKHLTKGVFDAIPVPVYAMENQRRIASILHAMDENIANRKRVLALLDELVKSRFVEMFGDLSLNDKNWPIEPFTHCAKIDSNMIQDFAGYEDYPHIGIDSIEKETGRLLEYRTVREDGVISGKYLFTPNHIIYSKIRPNLNKVALPTFVGLCSADAYPILPNAEVCNRIYLAYVLRGRRFLNYILAFSSRTNMPKVNRKQVEGFELPLPPFPLQQKFAAFVHQIDATKAAARREIAALETLRGKMMQEFFG